LHVQDKPIQLALETLATFNLQINMYNVAEFIREIVVSFLDDDESYVVSETNIPLARMLLTASNLTLQFSDTRDIRQAAARTCTSIMSRAEQTDKKMALVVSEVVEKLLIVGISDAGTCMPHSHICGLPVLTAR
jgi:hypothetical protein